MHVVCYIKKILLVVFIIIFYHHFLCAQHYLYQHCIYVASNVLLIISSFCATAGLHQGCNAHYDKALLLGSISTSTLIVRTLLRHSKDFTLSTQHLYTDANTIDKYSVWRPQRYLEINAFEMLDSGLPLYLITTGVLSCFVYYKNADNNYLNRVSAYIKNII